MRKFLAVLATAALSLLFSCFEMDLAGTVADASREITWWSTAEHGTFGELEFEITSDGMYTEPRFPAMFIIRIMLPEPVDPADISGANIDIIGKDPANTDINPTYSIQMESGNRAVRVLLPGLTDQCRYRIRLLNNSGVTLSGRLFALLRGDVFNDPGNHGIVNNDDILRATVFVPSDLEDQSNPEHVRSDIDCDGLVTAADLNSINTPAPPRSLGAFYPVFP